MSPFSNPGKDWVVSTNARKGYFNHLWYSSTITVLVGGRAGKGKKSSTRIVDCLKRQSLITDGLLV